MSASAVSNRLNAGGRRVAYRTAGDPANPPAVFVHGWLMHANVWRSVMAAQAATHYCIAFDLLGSADSDKPREKAAYSIASQAETVLASADTLKISAFSLIGHSMGGQIALQLVASVPDRVERLALVAPVVSGKLAAFPRRVTLPQMRLGKLLPFAVPPVSWLIRHPAIARRVFSVWFHHVPPLERWHEDMVRATDPAIVPTAYWAGRAIVETDLSASLPRIAAPSLVLTGRQDRVVPVSESALAADRCLFV